MSARKEEPGGYVIYNSSWEIFDMFSDNEQEAGKIMLAVKDYILRGKETEFKDRAMKIAYAKFKSDIELGRKRFMNKCESARRGSKNRLPNHTGNQINRIIPNKPDEPDDEDDRIMLDESVMMDIVNTETTRNQMNHIPDEPDDADDVDDADEPDDVDDADDVESCRIIPNKQNNVDRMADGHDEHNEGNIEISQSVSQSDKRGPGGDGRTDRPTDGQTFSTPPQIKTAWAKYYKRNMSMSDEVGIQGLLDSGYSEQQIINNIRDTAEYEPNYPLRYLRKALQEEKPTRSPSAKVSEREREIASKFEEYLKSTII